MTRPRPGVGRVVPLTYGWEHLPKTISVHGADPAVRLREPVPGVLLELDGGWLLLDVGFNDAVVRDAAWQRARAPRYVTELPGDGPGDNVEAAFARVGVDPADVVAVAVSHFHYDHAGGLHHFAGRVPVHAQRRELAYVRRARDDELLAHAYEHRDFDDPAIDWHLVDGDTEIVPGVTALLTAGHTPGHQSFLVDVDRRRAGPDAAPGFVFAFDAADLQENLDHELPVGTTVDAEPEATVESIRRLKAIARERGYRVVPGHDPDVWPAFTEELGAPNP
ncbi:MAG TPA: N-acyl homoserine lactonase family protein [Acidimicrobiia bacterium]|nr:N-acyl homoserine lactonase family protein [Acidimicrobiia bacterium]